MFLFNVKKICYKNSTKKQKIQVSIIAFFLYYKRIMQKTFREVIEEQIPMMSLVIVVAFIALFVGYGLWVSAHTGTLVVDSPAYGSRVFVDQHLAGTLKEAPDNVHLSEQTGKHNVIVSKEGYWPWAQDIEIKKNETTELHPFVIPQKVSTERVVRLLFSNGVTGIDPAYEKIAALFENLAPSDEVKPLVEATHIQNVSYADYAPGRTDVLLVATNDGIYAVGIEKSEHPNFQPVYKGENPLFVKATDNTLYIKEGDAIFHVKNLTL